MSVEKFYGNSGTATNPPEKVTPRQALTRALSIVDEFQDVIIIMANRESDTDISISAGKNLVNLQYQIGMIEIAKIGIVKANPAID